MFSLNGVEIEDTFAELFEMWVGRVLITSKNKKWAMTAASVATGYACSIIGSPAEAGIEGLVSPEDTPDNRVGVIIQVYHHSRRDLKNQLIGRIGQCIMTCPTVSVFDGLKKPIRKIKIGRSLRLFGDGFQKKDTLKGRKLWRIPVMEGDFIIQEDFGIKKAVAGGNFIILAESQDAGLLAAEEAVNAIRKKQKYVVMPFPGGICRSGSKIGSLKYKLPASTNHVFCPKLKDKINGTLVPEKTKCVYEIVINGLSFEDVKRAMSEGVKTATRIEGINRISAGNYDGKFGSMKIFLKDIIK